MRYLALIICFAPSAALGQRIEITPSKTHYTDLACISTTAAATRTLVIDTGKLGPNGKGFPYTVVELALTWNASATVTMTCSASDDGGTTDFAIQDCTMGSGTCTSSDLSWSKAVTASKNWAWRIDNRGFVRLECIMLCGGAGSDTLTAKSYQIAE